MYYTAKDLLNWDPEPIESIVFINWLLFTCWQDTPHTRSNFLNEVVITHRGIYFQYDNFDVAFAHARVMTGEGQYFLYIRPKYAHWYINDIWISCRITEEKGDFYTGPFLTTMNATEDALDIFKSCLGKINSFARRYQSTPMLYQLSTFNINSLKKWARPNLTDYGRHAHQLYLYPDIPEE